MRCLASVIFCHCILFLVAAPSIGEEAGGAQNIKKMYIASLTYFKMKLKVIERIKLANKF